MEKNIEIINKHIHFIGISGSGMIALTQFLRSKGRCKLSGSDLSISKAAQDLHEQGVKIYQGHHPDQILVADIVVYSSAIPDDNHELSAARKAKKHCIKRGDFLAYLMSHFHRQVVIAGTHGKTTTTGMVTHILDVAGITPSFMLGGELFPYFINGRYTDSSTCIAESDESDGSFLSLNPHYAVLTNLEPEHLNFYKTKNKLYQAFQEFVTKAVSNKAHIAINADNEELMSLSKKTSKGLFSYFSIKDPNAEFYASDIKFYQDKTVFNVFHHAVLLGSITIQTMGMHNIYNALSSVAICFKMDISFQKIQAGLSNFKGVKRRMQLLSSSQKINIYDDYGHHPSEVKTTLQGLKNARKGSITCVFQPHRYSRIKDHLIEFFDVFNDTDHVIITPIFSAQETSLHENLIEKMIDGIKQNSLCHVTYFQNHHDIVNYLTESLQSGDTVITMGAGDIYHVSESLAAFYKNSTETSN